MKNYLIASVLCLSGCATTPKQVEVKTQDCPVCPNHIGAPWTNPLKVNLSDLDTNGPSVNNQNIADAFAVDIRLTNANVAITAIPVTEAVFRKLVKNNNPSEWKVNGICASIMAVSLDKDALKYFKNWIVRFRSAKTMAVGQGKVFTVGEPKPMDGAWEAWQITCTDLPLKVADGLDIAVIAPTAKAWPAIFSWRP